MSLELIIQQWKSCQMWLFFFSFVTILCSRTILPILTWLLTLLPSSPPTSTSPCSRCSQYPRGCLLWEAMVLVVCQGLAVSPLQLHAGLVLHDEFFSTYYLISNSLISHSNVAHIYVKSDSKYIWSRCYVSCMASWKICLQQLEWFLVMFRLY